MEVFQKAILQVTPSELNPEACKQIWHLNLSKDLNTILQAIEVNNDTTSVYDIYGEPGSGCSTLMQGLCQLICERNTAKESEVLYLCLCKGFKEAVFLDFVLKLIKERYHDENLSLFTKMSSNIDLKKKSIAEFLGKHFKIICIDNAELCHDFSDSSLNDILKMCTATSFVALSQSKLERPGINNITVNGLSESSAIALVFKSLQPQLLTENEIANICCMVNFNPVAIQLICAVLNSQEENISPSSLLSELRESCAARNFGTQKSCIIGMVLHWIDKVSDISCAGILCSLSCLRQPLPMLDMSPELEKIVQLNLLRVKKEGKAQCIYLPSTINKFLTHRKDFYSKDNADFDLLQQWLSLVSNQKLHSLIREAEEHAWPFVPESWQFIDEKDVGENESSNVKEHIISNNAHIPSLTELQILHECLYHAYLQEDFQKLAAVTFVLDRFLFWQGDKKISMNIVDYIQKNSPETAIAPQLLVRRARVMKNEGNLRGAEEVLNEVSKEKTGVGHWKHRHEFQADLTRAACIQLKGEIQYILGNWVKSAGLLLESIELFNNLPKPDKKGLSLGYGLLCPCIRNMNHKDYSDLAQYFGLVQVHPLLAAYISAQEAARSSSYTPMFFVRHICHAGEVLLELIKLSTMEEEKQILLRVAIEDLKESIQAHQSYKSLTSREQFYILVLALFKLSLALLELQSKIDQDVGRQLKGIAAKLYEHYCSSIGHVLVDEKVVELIDKCMDLLQLEKYQSDDLPDAGQLLLRYYKRRISQRLRENTRLRVEGLFANGKQIPLSPVSPELLPYRESSVMHSPVDLKLLQHQPHRGLENVPSERKNNDKTVDHCAATVQDECAEAHDVERSKTKVIVDRCAVTAELKKKEEHLKAKATPEKDTAGQEVGLIVDRCAETINLKEKEEHLKGKSTSKKDTAGQEVGMAVDQCAEAAAHEEREEHLKAESTSEKDTAGQEDGLTTVDRCTETAAHEEREEHLKAKSTSEKDTAWQEVGMTVDRCAETAAHEEEEEHLKAKSTSEKDTAWQEVGLTVDRCAETVELEEKEEHLKAKSTPEKDTAGKEVSLTVDRCAETVELEKKEEHLKSKSTPEKDTAGQEVDLTVDLCALTAAYEEKEGHLKAESTSEKDTAWQEVGMTVDRCAVTAAHEEKEEHLKAESTSEKDTAGQEVGLTVDRCAETVELEEKEEHLKVKSRTEKDTARQEVALTVDRCAETINLEEKEEHLKAKSTPEKDTAGQESGKIMDKNIECAKSKVLELASEKKTFQESRLQDFAKNLGLGIHQSSLIMENKDGKGDSLMDDLNLTRNVMTTNRGDIQGESENKNDEKENISKTVDEYAFLMSRSVEGDSGIIVQSLEDEAISLPSQTQPQMALHFGVENLESNNDQLKRTRDGILWKYDYPSRKWRCNQVMVYVGGPLELKKGLEGAQRDVFTVEFINQDEPQQRYVAKRYRKKIHHQQYENDVLSQMTARHYVSKFNQDLSIASTGGESIGEIQFLPVVLLQLVNASGHVTDVLNAEPYMSGEFTKLTNNVDWKNEKRRTDLVLAYSHFTYQESDAKLIIVDIQGWAPRDNKGCTFLTDPQIHSPVFKCFGTGNHGKRGFERFWTELHSECNHICSMLKLKRP